MIEEKIFEKTKVNYDKLIKYGFTKCNDKYFISKNILDNSFRIEIEISDKVKGKIMDIESNEEYTNYRIENSDSKFITEIREQFINFLIDIKNNCFDHKYFVYNQSNRICNYIIDKYNDYPDFTWDKFPGYATFKNNNKWYAIIMNVTRDKIDEGKDNIEIMNIKLEPSRIKELLNKKGYYKAYHMKKDSWISIILDDTLSDEEIIEYLNISHSYTDLIEEWIIPANPKYYDVCSDFDNNDDVIWKQCGNIKNNDILYIYVTNPIKEVKYKCRVVESMIPYNEDNDFNMSHIMKLVVLKRYNNISFDDLKNNKITAIRGPRHITKEFKDFIDKI